MAGRLDAMLVDVWTVCDWPAHTVLARRGEPVRAVLVVLAGVVTLTHENGGLRVNLGVRGPGAVLGAESAVCIARHVATVTSVSRCTIGSIAATTFAQLLATQAQVRDATIRALADHAAEFMHATLRLTARRAPHRVAWTLVDVMNKSAVRRQDGSWILPFRLTMTDLAAITGVERETASRVASTLIRRHWLLKENGRLVAPAGSPLGRRHAPDATAPHREKRPKPPGNGRSLDR